MALSVNIVKNVDMKTKWIFKGKILFFENYLSFVVIQIKYFQTMSWKIMAKMVIKSMNCFKKYYATYCFSS